MSRTARRAILSTVTNGLSVLVSSQDKYSTAIMLADVVAGTVHNNVIAFLQQVPDMCAQCLH